MQRIHQHRQRRRLAVGIAAVPSIPTVSDVTHVPGGIGHAIQVTLQRALRCAL